MIEEPDMVWCSHCNREFVGPIHFDSEQLRWLGVDKSDPFCGPDCLNDASEAYWMDRNTNADNGENR